MDVTVSPACSENNPERPIIYRFNKTVADDEASGIERLYRSAGWWNTDKDNIDLVKRLVSGSHCFLSAWQNNQMIGMGRAISDGSSDAYIQDVFVEMRSRGMGIGKMIIHKIVEKLKEDKMSWVGLIAEGGSEKFYKQLGFSDMKNAIPMIMVELC